MTKGEYIRKLRSKLRFSLSAGEIQDIAGDISQVFANGIADGRSEGEICSFLGSPADAAMDILTDHGISPNTGRAVCKGSGFGVCHPCFKERQADTALYVRSYWHYDDTQQIKKHTQISRETLNKCPLKGKQFIKIRPNSKFYENQAKYSVNSLYFQPQPGLLPSKGHSYPITGRKPF